MESLELRLTVIILFKAFLLIKNQTLIVSSIIMFFYSKKIELEPTIMFWSFFCAHLFIQQAGFFIIGFLTTRCTTLILFVFQLYSHTEANQQLSNIWSCLRLYLGSSFASCWKIVEAQIGFGMTTCHSGFQNVIFVSVDNSLIHSFISLHICLSGCDYNPGTFLDTA